QARKTAQEAIADARRADHPASLLFALVHYALALAQYTRETEALDNTAAELLAESERQRFDRWNALAHDLQALARLRRGDRRALGRVIRPILAKSDLTDMAMYYGSFSTAAAGELLVCGELNDAWAI